MSSYIKLSKAEKEEIRRLTQKANRRIKAYLKSYEKAGMNVIPKEVTAGLDIQSRGQFQTDKYAISRSVKFESKADYKKHMNMLKKFDPNRATSVPTVTEYNKISRLKLQVAFSSSDGDEAIGKTLLDKVNKMSSADISKFWDEYHTRGIRKGLQYNSEAIMLDMAQSYRVTDAIDLMGSVLEKR